MSLPADLYTLDVTGTFKDAGGQALAGTITFTPSTPLTDSAGNVVIPAYAKPHSLSGGSLLAGPLVSNDTASLLPATYTVTVALQNIPQYSYSVQLLAAPFAFTATNATPCVFTATGSAYANGTAVMLTGSAPAGFTAEARYYVTSASGASFSLAATPGGPAIASTSTGSGTVSTASVDISDLQPVVPQGTSAPWVPQSQTFALANNAMQDIMQWTVTGQTDSPLPPFALIATSRTYGSSPAVQGPVAFFGYNAAMPIGGGTNGHGAATLSFFADAGDTNSSGAHGIEANLSFFTANDSLATGAFQMVAVDDNTNTVNTTIRCGSGRSGSYTSNIVFQNGNASTTFLVMSNSSRNATFEVPVVFSSGIRPPLTLSTNAVSTGAALTLSALGSSSTATVTLEGNNGGAANSIIAFNTNGTVQWQLEHTPPNLYLKDTVNNRSAFYFYPGSSASNSKFQVLSVLQSSSSLICGLAALTTTATDGFLYLPSCAGAPTGTPTTQTGTVPCVFDTTDGKLYFYTGGAWVGLAD